MAFHLFRTHTTGLIKPKKATAFKSYQDALDAGRALNLLDQTPDRVFIIIESSDIHTHSSITDELPFSETFFRLPRLSDSLSKFSTNSQIVANKFSLADVEKFGNLMIDTGHPALQSFTFAEFAGQNHSEILSKLGFNKQVCSRIQSHVQSVLGIQVLSAPISMTLEEQRVYQFLKETLETESSINKYVSSLVMSQFRAFGTTDFDKIIYSPAFVPSSEPSKEPSKEPDLKKLKSDPSVGFIDD